MGSWVECAFDVRTVAAALGGAAYDRSFADRSVWVGNDRATSEEFPARGVPEEPETDRYRQPGAPKTRRESPSRRAFVVENTTSTCTSSVQG